MKGKTPDNHFTRKVAAARATRKANNQTPRIQKSEKSLGARLRDCLPVVILEIVGLALIIPTAYIMLIDLEDRKQQRITNAWQLVTQPAPGNSGKGEALEYLNSEDLSPLTLVVRHIWKDFSIPSDKERISLAGINLSIETKEDGEVNPGTYLIGANLSKANLSGANLSRADLFQANLSETNLFQANLSKAFLFEANLSGANLSRADLSETNLSRADLSEAFLFEANLSETNLLEANLSETNLSRADLSEAFLFEANLSETNLSRADLSEAFLIGANLSRADLSEAFLSKTFLFGTNFSETDLSGVDLSEAVFHKDDLSEEELLKAFIVKEEFFGTVFHKGDLSEEEFLNFFMANEELRKSFLAMRKHDKAFHQYPYYIKGKPPKGLSDDVLQKLEVRESK